jgi:DNA (cytosine-5)-methyltransferase 1
MRPKVLDLFCGVGGFSLGMEQAGFDVVGAVEYDPQHAGTHLYNFPLTTTYCKSVSDFTRHDLPTEIEIDVIIGGPPCQGFSQGGLRNVNDSRNNLILEFMRVVEQMQPKYFVIENVPALIYSDYLTAIQTTAERAGYDCYYQKLNAINFGVSQDRVRVFIVGVRGDRKFDYPQPTTTGDRLSILLPPAPTVGECLAGLPIIENYDQLFCTDKINWHHSPEENFYYGYRRLVPPALSGNQRTRHSPEVVERFKNTKPGDREPVSRFYKLDPAGYARTLRAGTGRERGTHTAPRPIHPLLNRCITVREGARLMGYPDWFRFGASISTGFRQVGNSVAPPVARAIGAEILKSMGIIPTSPERAIALSKDFLLDHNLTTASQYFNVPGDRIPPRRTA